MILPDSLESYFEKGIPSREEVESACPSDDWPTVRWSCIAKRFGQGCCVSIALCQHYDINPFEEIKNDTN